MPVAKPLPQFAPGTYVRITKKGRNFGKTGQVLQVLEDTGADLLLTVPGSGIGVHATHDQVELYRGYVCTEVRVKRSRSWTPRPEFDPTLEG